MAKHKARQEVQYPTTTTGWVSPDALARYEYHNKPLAVVPRHDDHHSLNITIEVQEPTPTDSENNES